jgi:hypothetical protein
MRQITGPFATTTPEATGVLHIFTSDQVSILKFMRNCFPTAMLKFLDVLLTLIHFALIGFNLFGWIWVKTRKAHLITVAATAFSWFILGIWFGWGYCPITHWEWMVKEKLGETNLPNSFIKYYADKISGKDLDASVVDAITLMPFLLVIIIAVYLNFFRRKKDRAYRAS